MSLADCYRKGQLKRIDKDPEIVSRTLKMADQDIEVARRSFENEEYTWASVQVYTSMLNYARALLFNNGIREKSHYCVVEYLRSNWTDELGDLIDKLDVMRRNRHLTMYDSRDHISTADVNKHLHWCEEFSIKIHQLLDQDDRIIT